jgi:hypothetical protein
MPAHRLPGSNHKGITIRQASGQERDSNVITKSFSPLRVDKHNTYQLVSTVSSCTASNYTAVNTLVCLKGFFTVKMLFGTGSRVFAEPSVITQTPLKS